MSTHLQLTEALIGLIIGYIIGCIVNSDVTLKTQCRDDFEVSQCVKVYLPVGKVGKYEKRIG